MRSSTANRQGVLGTDPGATIATEIGSVTETAPATDTASSGLNGRMQRIAQHFTTFLSRIPAALGQGTMAQSMKVVLPSDQAAIPVESYPSKAEYETVAASQTDQALGATGATGDYLEGLLCVVATAATAAVSIKDGAGGAISVFPNSPGAGVGTYYVPVMAKSTAGAWKVTTGAGVTVLATGNFT